MSGSSTSLTFNPGPSQLSEKILKAIQEITLSGFLSQSHRGNAFVEMSKKAVLGIKEKMGIPKEYHFFYQPSATAAMDTLLKNTVAEKSFHFVHGAFSKVFFDTALGIGLKALAFESPPEQAVNWENANIPSDTELLALTHNETSTGLMWPKEALHKIRANYPHLLFAIDVTSSFGAMKLEWQDGDIWFGSVQKCLGLPAGLGFLIVNPRAFEKAKGIKTRKALAPWQHFDALEEKMKLFQTPETPNMFNIALLARQMENWDLEQIENLTLKKAKVLYEAKLPWTPYVVNPDWRSLTVVNFKVDSPLLWKERAAKEGMTLGSGYGALKESCIRIANFPALSLENIERLIASLKIS